VRRTRRSTLPQSIQALGTRQSNAPPKEKTNGRRASFGFSNGKEQRAARPPIPTGGLIQTYVTMHRAMLFRGVAVPSLEISYTVVPPQLSLCLPLRPFIALIRKEPRKGCRGRPKSTAVERERDAKCSEKGTQLAGNRGRRCTAPEAFAVAARPPKGQRRDGMDGTPFSIS